MQSSSGSSPHCDTDEPHAKTASISQCPLPFLRSSSGPTTPIHDAASKEVQRPDNPHHREDEHHDATSAQDAPPVLTARPHTAPTTAAELSAALPLKLVKKLLYAHDDIRYKISAQVKRERADLAEEEQRQCVLLEERDERASLSAESVNAAIEVLRLDIRSYQPLGRRLIDTEEHDERSHLRRRRDKSLLRLAGRPPSEPPVSAPHPPPPVSVQSHPQRAASSSSINSRGRPPAQLDWKCSFCLYTNFACRTLCNRCSTPRDESNEPRPRHAHVSSSDGKNFPPDWECKLCRSINFARRTECHRCCVPRMFAESSPPAG